MLPVMTAAPYSQPSTIPGIVFRHLRAPEDYAAMNELSNASSAADGQDSASSEAQFRAFYEHLSNCDPAQDVVIAERDGVVVGYGRASWWEELDGQRVYDPSSFQGPDAAVTGLMGAHPRGDGGSHHPDRERPS